MAAGKPKPITVTKKTPSPAIDTANLASLERWIAFALAGVAAFALVLEQHDVSHDNRLGLAVLGGGAVTGLVVGAIVAAPRANREGATRVAWDVVRFVLAYEVIRYGVPKLLGMQFYPQYFRRDKRVIDLASSSLAWEFFGRSYFYQAFGGLVEVVSGVLLCTRRTMLLGACLLLPALVNVVLINFFYGVDVKLFASVYLLFDLALLAPHVPRLWSALVPPVERVEEARPGRWLYALAATVVIVGAGMKMTNEALTHHVFTREPLEGAWSVEEPTGAAWGWDRIYFEKDDVGFIRSQGSLVPFHKHLEGDQLRLSVAEDDRLANAGQALARVAAAGADAFPRAVHGALHLDGRTATFEGTCDEKPCGMKLTREFPR